MALCPEKDFFGHPQISHPMAYEPFFEPNWKCTDSIPFSIPHLNEAADCLRQYLTTQETTEWFHLQVYGVAFDSFCRAMEEDGGRTVLLPFWCWCNGGRQRDVLRRQHRHMIAVSPKGHFLPNVWIQVTQSARIIRIKSALHLLNTIVYLGQRYSECQVAYDVQTHLNHFYIHRSIARDFKWVLACLWEGGIEALIDHEYKDCPILDLVPYAKRIGPSYVVAIKDLPHLPLHLQVPVAPPFQPTGRATPYFLHAVRGRKLYYEKGGPHSEAAGYAMSRIVGDERWRPPQQHYLDVLVPLVAQRDRLQAEILKLKRC